MIPQSFYYDYDSIELSIQSIYQKMAKQLVFGMIEQQKKHS